MIKDLIERASQHAQGTEQWRADRIGMLTSTRCSVVDGSNTYETPQTLLKAMVREHLGMADNFKGNAATDYGTEHEPWARSKYESVTGNFVIECGMITHPDHPRLAASVDGLVTDSDSDQHEGLVEIKNPFKLRKVTDPAEACACYDDDKWDPIVVDDLAVPRAHWVQMQCAMQVCDMTWCDYVMGYGNATDIVFARVFRDDEYWERMLPVFENFIEDFDRICDDPEAIEALVGPEELDLAVDEKFADLERQMLDAQSILNEAKAHVDLIREEMLRYTDEKPARGTTFLLQFITKRGNVNWRAPEIRERLADLNLDDFRSKTTQSWRLTKMKKGQA